MMVNMYRSRCAARKLTLRFLFTSDPGTHSEQICDRVLLQGLHLFCGQGFILQFCIPPITVRRNGREKNGMIAWNVHAPFAIVQTETATGDGDGLTDDIVGIHELMDRISPDCHSRHAVLISDQHVHASRRAHLWRVDGNDDTAQPNPLSCICKV